jgi:small-conductance mechanosensitive channel
MQVRIDKFGESSIDLLIYCFTNTNVWIDFLRIKEGLLLKIKEVVEEAGARFAVPASSVYIEKVDEKMARPELPKALKAELGRRRKRREAPPNPEDAATFLNEDEK